MELKLILVGKAREQMLAEYDGLIKLLEQSKN